jgi:hypothetical protein
MILVVGGAAFWRCGMRIIEINGHLSDDLEELLLISGKLKTQEQLMREMLLSALDPAIPMGPEFEFEIRPPEEDYISLEVPEVGSKCDLALAWQTAKQDARGCEIVLGRDESMEATLRVYTNSLRWLAFWAHRHPNDRWRAVFERQLKERKAVLQALKERAKYNPPMLEELKQVL